MPRKVIKVKISECYRRPIAFPTGLPWRQKLSPLEGKIKWIQENGPDSMPPIDIRPCNPNKNHNYCCPSIKYRLEGTLSSYKYVPTNESTRYKYYVIDGCHRCAAFEILGYIFIRASI